MYISKTGETDTEEMKKTRKNAFKNLKNALSAFPKSCNYERDMISHLVENPKDFKGALRKLPTGLVKMCVSAYQSYIFNRALFELMQKNRAKKDTTIPVPGYLFSSRIFSKEEDECVEKLLLQEKISPCMFKIKEMPELSSEGEKRPAFAPFYDFEIISVSKDNQNKGKTKATLRFTLDKGSYATVFLRNFFDGV